ncbi:MAG: hypothetical protein ACYTEZ_18330, partial [Planctomycetota bacterium]
MDKLARTLGGLLLLALAAQGAPSAKRVASWKAPANQKRLQLQWHDLPETAKQGKAPWPFLLFVAGVPSKLSAKIAKDVFANTSVVLAAKLCQPVRITPDAAVGLPYLKALPRIRDPMLVVVGRDWRVHGVLADKRQFTVQHCFDLLARAADEEYEITLTSYVASYLKILERAEQLWRQQRRVVALERSAAKKSGADQAKAEAELKQRREELQSAQKALRLQEALLRTGARLKGGT